MNTLSSGYAASAQRSVSGATTKSTTAEETTSTAPSTAASSAPAPARRRIVAPPPTSYRPSSANGESDEPSQQQGKMLYPYTATGPDEISVDEGQDFTLLEPDDGSGWIKIKPTTFGSPSGLVPAAYAELSAPAPTIPAPPPRSLPAPTATAERPVSTATTNSASGSDTGNSTSAPKVKKQGPAVAPRRGGGRKASHAQVRHVEALYTYSASGAGEVDMVEGEKMVLLQSDQGDGWCEVQSAAGKGVVPASWVREV